MIIHNLPQHCGHDAPGVGLKPSDAYLNAVDGELQVVGLAVVIGGSQVVCAEGAQ